MPPPVFNHQGYILPLMPHSSTASDPKKVYSQEYYVHFVLRVHLLRMFEIQNILYTNLKDVLFNVPTCAHLIRNLTLRSFVIKKRCLVFSVLHIPYDVTHFLT